MTNHIICLISLIYSIVMSAEGAANNPPSRHPGLSGIQKYDAISLTAERLFRRGSTVREPVVTLNINALGEQYSLTLEQNTDLIPDDVPVPEGVDRHSWYTGKVNGAEGGIVHFTISQDGVFDGVFSDKKQGTIYVEPASKHFDGPQTFNHIVYREADTDAALDAATRLRTPLDTEMYAGMQASEKKTRAVASKGESFNVCTVALYASNPFYNTQGSTVASAFTAMLNRFNVAKQVFETTATNLDVGTSKKMEKVRLQLVRWKVDTTGSAIKGLTTPTGTGVTPAAMLNAASQIEDLGVVDAKGNALCLGHMFVNYDFSGTLGLAWVGATTGALGGICDNKKSSQYGYTNVGFTSALSFGKPVPYAINGLVTAHEMGHGFGCTHDATPTTNVFLMYAYASEGTESNNNQFSQNSRNLMAPVIKRNGGCFLDVVGPVCGNLIVEESEVCDCGGTSVDSNTCAANDKCCSTDCNKLASGAKCSPLNPKQGSCCTSGCDFASNTTACTPATVNNCALAPICNGFGSCVATSNKTDGTLCDVARPCTDNLCPSFCLAGECSQSVCQNWNLTECAAPAGDSSCRVYCMMGGVCKATGTLNANANTYNIKIDEKYYKAVGSNCAFKDGLPNSGSCSPTPTNLDQAMVCKEVTVAAPPDSPIDSLAGDVTGWLQESSYGLTNYIWVIFFVLLAILLFGGSCTCCMRNRDKGGQGKIHA